MVRVRKIVGSRKIQSRFSARKQTTSFNQKIIVVMVLLSKLSGSRVTLKIDSSGEETTDTEKRAKSFSDTGSHVKKYHMVQMRRPLGFDRKIVGFGRGTTTNGEKPLIVWF